MRSLKSTVHLITLEPMPCGCVTALYRANPTAVEVELVEAKGPHCRFYGHRDGQMISLSVAESLSPERRKLQI